MDNAAYLALGRLGGLHREMQAVANNIANMSTAGFRREGIVFAEVIAALPVEGGSVSIATARVRHTDFADGGMERTGGAFDLALEGEGFFLVGTPEGERLTRAGSFLRDAAGLLTTAEGHPVLDPGGAPVQLPLAASAIEVTRDGAVTADGQVVGAVAVVRPENPDDLLREDGVRFRADGPLVPAEAAVFQGYLEASNVSAITELARMIEVQRAYEIGQTLLDREDERVRTAVRTLGPPG